jgi:hypothetical protein
MFEDTSIESCCTKYDTKIGIASSSPKILQNSELVKWDVTENLDAYIVKYTKAEHGKPMFYFQSIETKQGSKIALDLFVYDYIELMNEFLSKNLHDGENYQFIEKGKGFSARRGKNNDGIPILKVDVYCDGLIIETLELRRYEMRVAVNKLKRLLSQCTAMVS